jgi:hypothetical protein
VEDEPGRINDEMSAGLGEEVSGMLIGLGFKDLGRNNFSAPDIHDEVEEVENAAYGTSKIGDVPGPHLTGAGGNVLTRFLGRCGTRVLAMGELSLLSENAVKSRFRGQIAALIGQLRDDLLGGITDGER